MKVDRIQVIEQDGKPAFYVVPADVWERVREAVEEAEDLVAVERFDRDDNGVRYPDPVAKALLAGSTPLRAWRQHLGMTAQALAASAGLSRPYLTQIESGRRTGTLATLERLAHALGVPVAALVQP
jgi:DNA-binding XRE family transcriptional regulator